MALPIPHNLGPEISVLDFGWWSERGSRRGYPSDMWVHQLRDNGVEYSQRDHVHMVVMVPPKLAISDFLGRVKGQTAMKLFRWYRELRKKPYRGNHFWAKDYCVDTLDLDPEMIQKYVRK